MPTDDRTPLASPFVAATVGLAAGAVVGTAVLAADRTLADSSLPAVVQWDPATARVLIAALGGAVVAVVAFGLWLAARVRDTAGAVPTSAAPVTGLRVGVVVTSLTLALLVFRSLPSGGPGTAPHVSVFVALAALIAAVALVLRATRDAFGTADLDVLVQRMAEEAMTVVQEEAERVADEEPLATADFVVAPSGGRDVRAGRSGWVTAVDGPGLLQALPPGTEGCLRTRAGRFVLQDTVLLTVRPRPGTTVDYERAQQSITIADTRDRARDIELRLQEIADIGEQTTEDASPDLVTLREVIEHLRVVLREILVRDVAPHSLADREGRRLARPHELTIEDVLRASLERLRISSGHLPGIADALVEAAAFLEAEARRGGDADAAQALAAFAERAATTDHTAEASAVGASEDDRIDATTASVSTRQSQESEPGERSTR